jgi:hypothetical protein
VSLWEIQKRESTDTRSDFGCTLMDMMGVIGRFADSREGLRYSNGNSYIATTGLLAEFRNQIMHPVSALILRNEDVLNLKETLHRIAEIRDRVAELKGKIRQRTPRGIRYLP